MNWLKNKRTQTHLFIFISAFILFANTFSHEYAWDDKIVIEKNPRVQKGISGIPQLFVKYSSQYQYDKYGYRPITLSSFAFDYSISNGNPKFSHIMNAFYYAILCVLIFIFLSALFSQYHFIFALIASLLFLVHPLHVEVVANIKSRDEIFGLLFSIASFITFLKYLKTKQLPYILYTLLLYLLAYLSKENSITMLAIFPLILAIKKIKISLKLASAVGGMLLLLGVISTIIYILAASSTADAETSMGKGIFEENGILGNSFFHLSGFGQKLPNAMNVLGIYLKNFILPYPLIYYYGYNIVPATGWGNIGVIVSLLIHFSLAILGIKYLKSRPEILFGFLFYAISISIYTHLFRTLSDTMADRFLFFGSLGLCILLTGILGLIFKINWSDLKDKKLKSDFSIRQFIQYNKILGYSIIIISVVLSGVTFARNKNWKDDMTLVKHDLPYMQNCARAHYYYASLLNKQLFEDKSLFNNAQKRTQVESEMIKEYKRSMELSDYSYLSYLELGTYYCRIYNYNEGISILKKGVELFPEAPDMAFYLGQTYVLINENALAVPWLEKSIKLSYNQPTNYYFLSLAYSRTNRLEEALKVVDDGMKKFENDKGLFYDALGFIYFDHDQLDKSIEYTLKLKETGKPEKDVYSYIIGRCYAKGDTAKGNYYKEEARLKGIVFQ